MPPPAHVVLGPRTRTVIDGAVWRRESQFPASQKWADETERVLAFLESHGVFGTFLPRLRSRERGGAFAEARVAYFFHCNGFRILAWEPEDVSRHPGDLEIQWPDTEPIFVEVKGPGWEDELSPEEREAGRKAAGKHVDMEARAVDSVGPILYAIDKCLPKLSPARCNLIVVIDDLFVSPATMPAGWIDSSINHHLAAPERSVVGAVLVMTTEMYEEGMDTGGGSSPTPRQLGHCRMQCWRAYSR